MLKWLAKLEYAFLVWNQKRLEEHAYYALYYREHEWYQKVKNKRTKNENRALKLKNKYSL